MHIQPAKPEDSVEEISLVLVGDFNPKIFHPMWFLHEDLIRESEAQEANIDISHQDVSSFRLEWVTVQVLRDRFTAKISADVYKKHLGDLVLNVFSKLNHTPVHQLGMNISFRIRFKSNTDWHSFGHFLLPKSPWANVFDKPGLRHCNVRGFRIDDDRSGIVGITVEPDMTTQFDAIIRINDHFNSPTLDDKSKHSLFNANWAVEILREDFEHSIDRATKYTNTLINNFLQTRTVDDGVIE